MKNTLYNENSPQIFTVYNFMGQLDKLDQHFDFQLGGVVIKERLRRNI